MFLRKNLCASARSLLRCEPRLQRGLPPNSHHNSPSSRVFTRFFILSHKPSVSLNCRHGLFLEPRVLWISSFSSEREGGEGPAFKCWNCGAAAPSIEPFLACSSCRSVQPMNRSVDYFQIFGLERRYDIVVDNLEGKYKDWQKKLHPDLVHSKSEKERIYAAEQSARVIDAYRTLNKPLSRALYLLRLEGIHVDEEKTVSDPELLTEMMDIRETVEEADDSHALEQIQFQIHKKFEAWSNSFQEAFQKQDFDNAISSTQRMRYYERAIEEVVKKL